ncbi:YopX family protein [Campylobacter lari]|nr:hypothetical protein [Campylobacter lari]MCV3431412.1 YopX family protein [Campylobacter lari]
MKLQDFDFRVWSKLENGFIEYPALAKLKSVLPAKSHYVDELIPCIKFDERDDEKELELWTGIYDENGKKIYENDILEFFDYEEGYRIIQVQYNTDYGFFYKENYYIEKINNIDNKEFIILGNIHENPELLKC